MPQDLDLTAFNQAQWERYCQLSATTFILYEHLLQVDSEIRLFWKKRWTFGKCVFLWSRYYSLCFSIGNTSVFMQHPISNNLCINFFHWQNTGATLQVVTTHVILYTRLYAMYRCLKRVLVFLASMFCLEVVALGVIVGMPPPSAVGTNNYSPGLFICADGDAPHQHWIAYYWTCALCVDIILLLMAMYKAWAYRKCPNKYNLMRVLAWDSIIYFVVIFVLYTTNQVIWLRNTITLNEVATGFSFSISAVMANRLMLSVRSRYYSSLTLIDPDLFTTVYTAERLTNLTVLEEHGSSVNDVLVSAELFDVYTSLGLDNYNDKTGI